MKSTSLASMAVALTVTSCPATTSAFVAPRPRNAFIERLEPLHATEKRETPFFAVLERPSTKNTATLDRPTDDQSKSMAQMPSQAKAVKNKDESKEPTESQKLMQQVKDAGLAGIISYAFWELGFWFVSLPVVLFGYREVTGHWPDLSNQEDLAKLSAEAFAFVNFARFAVPLRIGLALSTTPWVEEHVVERFKLQGNQNDSKESQVNGVVANGAVNGTANGVTKE